MVAFLVCWRAQRCHRKHAAADDILCTASHRIFGCSHTGLNAARKSFGRAATAIAADSANIISFHSTLCARTLFPRRMSSNMRMRPSFWELVCWSVPGQKHRNTSAHKGYRNGCRGNRRRCRRRRPECSLESRLPRCT